MKKKERDWFEDYYSSEDFKREFKKLNDVTFERKRHKKLGEWMEKGGADISKVELEYHLGDRRYLKAL